MAEGHQIAPDRGRQAPTEKEYEYTLRFVRVAVVIIHPCMRSRIGTHRSGMICLKIQEIDDPSNNVQGYHVLGHFIIAFTWEVKKWCLFS